MERLQRPAILDEPGREPVEQLRVRRELAQPAEIVDRTDQALAEMPAPDAIHDHPGRERVPRAGQPSGQLEPAAGLGAIAG